MSLNKAIGQAVRLYESFREARPRKVGAVKVKVPRAVAVMGYVEAIDYRTTHGGKTELYRHDFAPGSRPLLAVSADGKQVLLLGGRYQFTEQGIVDKDARGRLIKNPGHGKTLNPRKSAQYKRGFDYGRDGYNPATGGDAEFARGIADGAARRREVRAAAAARKGKKRKSNPAKPATMDSATGAALASYARLHRVPSGVITTMRILWANDPKYWTGRGFAKLEEAVRALKP
jgi:hypothetical protein